MRSFSFVLSLLLLTPATLLVAKTDVVFLDKIITVVNDDIITQVELDTRVKIASQQMQQQGNSLPKRSLIEKQILERLILEKIQLDLAKKSGVRVNDSAVNQALKKIGQQNNLSMKQLRQAIKKDGFLFSDFRENIRREVTIARLRKIHVENKINVSEQEIESHLSRYSKDLSSNDEYRLSQILIATPEAATPEQVETAKKKADNIYAALKKGDDFAEKAIAVSNDEQALKGGDLGWRKLTQLPSAFSAFVRTMNIKTIKGPIRSARGFHIIKLQDKRSKNEKHIIKQTLARHILIRPNQVLNRAEAHARLEQLLQRIKSGSDFATLARASSDDKASAAEGGSLGWVSPGSMVPTFEEEMNKLKPGEISEPFLSQFGWHIVQVMSRRKHDNSQQFQRSQAIQLIRKNKTEEAVQNWLRRLRAEAYVDDRINK